MKKRKKSLLNPILMAAMRHGDAYEHALVLSVLSALRGPDRGELQGKNKTRWTAPIRSWAVNVPYKQQTSRYGWWPTVPESSDWGKLLNESRRALRSLCEESHYYSHIKQAIEAIIELTEWHKCHLAHRRATEKGYCGKKGA